MEIDKKTNQQITTRCVLETTDDDEKLPLVEVNEKLIRKLKPHQVEGKDFYFSEEKKLRIVKIRIQFHMYF